MEVKAPSSAATKAKSQAPNLRELYIEDVDNTGVAEEVKMPSSSQSKGKGYGNNTKTQAQKPQTSVDENLTNI